MDLVFVLKWVKSVIGCVLYGIQSLFWHHLAWTFSVENKSWSHDDRTTHQIVISKYVRWTRWQFQLFYNGLELMMAPLFSLTVNFNNAKNSSCLYIPFYRIRIVFSTSFDFLLRSIQLFRPKIYVSLIVKQN